MTQEQYDKMLWQKIHRHVSLFDRSTPMLFYSYGRKLSDEEQKLMRVLDMAHENIELFRNRHPEFTATWLKPNYLKK